jgi:hypothetical protein
MRKFTEGIILLHDNVCAAWTTEARTNRRPYYGRFSNIRNSTRTPCDLDIFGPLQKAIEFTLDDELQDAVVQWFR